MLLQGLNQVFYLTGARVLQVLQDQSEDFAELPHDPGGQLPKGHSVSQPPPRVRRDAVDAHPSQFAKPRGE